VAEEQKVLLAGLGEVVEIQVSTLLLAQVVAVEAIILLLVGLVVVVAIQAQEETEPQIKVIQVVLELMEK
jgi:hypothetical protein